MMNLTIIQRLYAGLSENKPESLRELFSPEVEWIQSTGFPGGGRHLGFDAILREVFTKNRQAWNHWHADVHQWLEAGDTIVALGQYQGTHRDTGRSMIAAFAHVYDLQDGRIVRFRQFADTAQIREALAARENLAALGLHPPAAG
jgi:ketosteroid isomerase-like protein